MVISAALALGGVFWALAYLLCIQVGERLRTSLFPVPLILLNITWEFVYATHDLFSGFWSEGVVSLVWFLIDARLLLVFLKHGEKGWARFESRASRCWMVSVGAVLALVIQLTLLFSFGGRPEGYSAIYSAYVQNVLMSVVFLWLIMHAGSRGLIPGRKECGGKVLAFGMCKLVGTLLPTLVFWLEYDIAFVKVAGGLCLVMDICFCLFGWRALKKGKWS